METNESEFHNSANEIEAPSWTNFYNNLLYEERPIFYCCHVSNDPIKKTKRKSKKSEKKGSDKYVNIDFNNFSRFFHQYRIPNPQIIFGNLINILIASPC